MNSHEINIYGDIVPFKMWNDGSEYDRADLNNAIDGLDLQEGDELLYNIHTFGGCTTTAFSMYNKLLRIKSEKKITLTSRSDGYCASSGVILLLAADKRIGSKYLTPFVHNAWTWVDGANKHEAKKAFESLDKTDNDIAELYSETTSITKDEALSLMNESRDVTIEECLSFGFYTDIENVYAAENSMILNSLRSRNSKNRNLKSNQMSKDNITKEEVEGTFDKILNKLGFKGSKSEPKNKMVLDATGEVEIDFPDLEANDTPSVGDMATVDGSPAMGEHLMPNGETFVFAAGELMDIKPKEDEVDDNDEEMVALQDEIENLKKDNAKKDKKIKSLNTKIEGITEDVLELKRSVGSSFKHNVKKKSKKEEGENRSVFKQAD